MKKILSDSLILTGTIVVTFLVGFFVISWVFGLLASVLSENQLVVRLCNFIPYFILVLAVLFTFAYKKEYKREAFSRQGKTLPFLLQKTSRRDIINRINPLSVNQRSKYEIQHTRRKSGG